MGIRNLRADEIDVRVQSIGKQGDKHWAVLLLYKDARCDMNILDEVYGITGWQRSHQILDGNLYCTVSIKDIDGQWVSKQDVGTESNTEKEKGQASDSFKRACFNIGIGRELYTAPIIFIYLEPNEIEVKDGKEKVKSSIKFTVADIKTNEDKQIIGLKIIDKTGKVRFTKGF